MKNKQLNLSREPLLRYTGGEESSSGRGSRVKKCANGALGQSLVVSLLLFKKSKLSPSPAGLCRTRRTNREDTR